MGEGEGAINHLPYHQSSTTRERGEGEVKGEGMHIIAGDIYNILTVRLSRNSWSIRALSL